MVNQPNNARSAASSQAIEAALINLLQDRDLSAISVKAICSQAGVSRSTFYLHYDNIDALIQSVERRFEQDLLPYFDYRDTRKAGSEVQSPYLSCTRWFEYCLKHAAFLRAILGQYGDHGFEYRMRERLRREVGEMMDYDNMPQDKNRKFILECMVASILALLHCALEDDSSLETQQIAFIANIMREGPVILKRQELGLADGRT